MRCILGRCSVRCSQTGKRIQKHGITAGGEPSSTCRRSWPPSWKGRGWSPPLEPSRTSKTATAAAAGRVAGGSLKSFRETWNPCGCWPHQQSRRRNRQRKPRGACRGSRPSAGWTLGCIEGATEHRSSTAHRSGTAGRWGETRSYLGVLWEPDLFLTCLDKVLPATQTELDIYL